MTVPGTNGVLAFGLQAAKGTPATTFYRHAAMTVSGGTVEMVQPIPQEVDSKMSPTGTFKGGQFGGLNAVLNPRLKNDFGLLLYGLMGDVNVTAGNAPAAILKRTELTAAPQVLTVGFNQPTSPYRLVIQGFPAGPLALTGNIVVEGTDVGDLSITDTIALNGNNVVLGDVADEFKTIAEITLPVRAQVGDSVTVGIVPDGVDAIYRHQFTFDADNEAFQPWMTVRKVTPGSVSTDVFREDVMDAKLASMVLQITAANLMNAQVMFQGREAELEIDPTLVYVAASEDYRSIPMGSTELGGVTIPGFNHHRPMTIVAAQVSVNNQLSDPQSEMILGSYHPDDIIALVRSATMNLTVKWSDPQLYARMLTGSNTGGDWTPEVFESEVRIVVGSLSPIDSAVSNAQYRLEIFAPRVTLTPAGPPELAGGQMLMMQVQGQVLTHPSQPYLSIYLDNQTDDYLA